MQSFADRSGVRKGITGEMLPNGIRLIDANRATSWEFRNAGIRSLLRIADGYRKRGVDAVVVGVIYAPKKIKYAVFVEEGFLK